MKTISMVPHRRLVLDHPESITSNRTARLNTNHHRLTTTPGITIGRPDGLFKPPSRPHLMALLSNRTSKIAPKIIVTVLIPHKAGLRHS